MLATTTTTRIQHRQFSGNALRRPPKSLSHPSAAPAHKPRTRPISCTNKKKLSDAVLASELAMEVAKLNTQTVQKQEAMKKSEEVLFAEICRYASLKKDEMKSKWRKMEEEEKLGLVKDFVSNWGVGFQPLSARSVKEMVDDYLQEEKQSSNGSSFLPGLKWLMGFGENQ